MHHVLTQGRVWAIEFTKCQGGWRASQPELDMHEVGESRADAAIRLGERLEEWEYAAIKKHAWRRAVLRQPEA